MALDTSWICGGNEWFFFLQNSHPEIQPGEIELGELLGSGSFSRVYKGKCRGQDVAVKVRRKERKKIFFFKRKKKKLQVFNIQNDPDELENIRKEIAVMSQIFHPNVVLFMGAATDPKDKLMVVTERLPTDLYKLLIENRNKYDLSLRKRMKMAKEAALGVNWLHCGKQLFIHRDLKVCDR
jgi:serine/threonine protein kinase